jgi:hypothetical protein
MEAAGFGGRDSCDRGKGAAIGQMPAPRIEAKVSQGQPLPLHPLSITLFQSHQPPKDASVRCQL